MEQITDRISIHLGDCRDVLPVVCDAVVTDPPYGMAHPCNYRTRRGNSSPLREGKPIWKNGRRNDWDNVAGDDKPFDPEWILAMDKPTVLWGGNWFANKLPAVSGWLVWDKDRPDELDQATCELAWTNCVKGVRRFKHLWNGFQKASEQGESLHPTQKPVALFSWTLNLRWLAGVQTVFDPYMGSAPCGIACHRAGKRYIGCEINPQHYATARERLLRETAQGLLDLDNNPL